MQLAGARVSGEAHISDLAIFCKLVLVVRSMLKSTRSKRIDKHQSLPFFFPINLLY